MPKFYQAKFWKDRIWVTLIPGVLGLIFLISGITGTIVSISLILKDQTKFWEIFGAFLIFLLPFLLVGSTGFYIFLYGVKTKIIIDDKFLILDAPFYKKKILIQDIQEINIVEKRAPVITYSGKGPTPVFFKGVSINVVYEKEGKRKKLSLPCWRKGYYFPQIAADLKKINSNIKT